MIGPVAYGTLPNRTHLSERERKIWAAFMQQWPGFCKSIWYDVECGGMRGGVGDLKPEWAQNAKYLGRYKIDVVGENDESMFVFEVKGEATTKAMGELWLYDDLLKEEWKFTKPVRCICISDEEMPNVRLALEKEGYELVIVDLSKAQVPVLPASTVGDEKTNPDKENGGNAEDSKNIHN